MNSKRLLKVIGALVGAAIALYIQQRQPDSVPAVETQVSVPKTKTQAHKTVPSGNKDKQSNLRRLFQQRRSGVWVEATGKVTRLLSDDNDGDRHQRMIVTVDSHTVLIAHNIDLAPRVPISRGENLRFRGRYEYNEQGGVVHWTHKHPKGRGQAGWLSYRDKKYW